MLISLVTAIYALFPMTVGEKKFFLLESLLELERLLTESLSECSINMDNINYNKYKLTA